MTYFQVLVFCEDALVTNQYKVGPAIIYPCNSINTHCNAIQIRDFCKTINLYIPESVDIEALLNSEKDKKKPCFVVLFPKIMVNNYSELNLYLKKEMKKILGIISLNRSAYPVPMTTVFLKNENGKITGNFSFQRSYYRGNLLGGIISGENPITLNKHYNEISESEIKSEILDKYRFSNREIDIDYAYLRYWSVLEAISNTLFDDQHINTVRNLIIEAYGNVETANNTIVLKLGEESFNFKQLTEIWYNLRNYTAHNGGFYNYKRSGRKVNSKVRRLINALNNNKMRFEYGEDRSLMILKDVVDRVMKHYILKN